MVIHFVKCVLLLPGEFHGQRRLVRNNPWGFKVHGVSLTKQLTHIYTLQDLFKKTSLR